MVTTPVGNGQVLTGVELAGLLFRPDPNVNGDAGPFTYTVADGIAAPVAGAVAIAIDAAPDARGDTAATVVNTAVVTGNVLANDDQGDGPATITTFDAASARGGTVVNNGNGTFTYTPAPGFTGSDSFTYTIADSDGTNRPRHGRCDGGEQDLREAGGIGGRRRRAELHPARCP